MKGQWSQKLKFGLKNGQKLQEGKTNIFYLSQDQQLHPAGEWVLGELAGRGSVAVAVGVSDMWHVTGYTCRGAKGRT